MPIVTGCAVALSSSGRLGNTLGRDGQPLDDPVVWILLALAVVTYSALLTAAWSAVARLTERRAMEVLAVVVTATVVIFLVAYPRYGRPAGPSGYGDADDALNILADALTGGLGVDPYQRRTYLGNVLSPMLGAGIVAVPFRVVFGSAAYQNPFWLVVATMALYRQWGARVALGVIVPVLVSLGFAEDYILGGDYFASGIALALAAFAFLAALARGGWWPWGAALALGVLSANRTTTLPVLALVAAVLFAARRLRPAVGPLALALAVNLALWLPWWILADAFPPIGQVAKLGSPAVRGLALAILVATLLWVAAGRWRRPTAGSPSVRISNEGWTLTTSIGPALVWNPIQLFRATTYLWLAVPMLASRLEGWFRPAPESESGGKP